MCKFHISFSCNSIFVFFNIVRYFVSAIGEEPEFVEQIQNVTASVGRNVKLTCCVRNLGSYKVNIHFAYFSCHILFFPSEIRGIFVYKLK